MWAASIISPKALGYPSLFQKHDEIVSTKNRISLSALLYRDTSHWTVWINGQKITPDHQDNLQAVLIEEVTSQEVTFSWTPSNSTQKQIITLRPGQTMDIEDQTKTEDQ